MYSQFHSRYPTGGLVSELLQVHEGSFVVRVVVQVGGVTLASGLSAATCIEQAEDQARHRALAVLGITQTPYETQAQLMPNETVQQLPARLNPAQSSGLPYSQSAALADFNAQVYPDAPARDWDLAGEAGQISLSDEQLYAAPYSETPSPTSQRNRKRVEPSSRGGRNSLSKPPIAEPPLLPDEPIDLSEIIAQTSVELKRLGWNETQGRNYLQRTYGKRSRQQLNDEELLDFLHYLQTSPSPGEPSF